MTIFKLKDFARAARKEGVTDVDLLEAVERAARGLVDGEIGRFLVEQRLARQGKGRATGLRAVMSTRLVRSPCCPPVLEEQQGEPDAG